MLVAACSGGSPEPAEQLPEDDLVQTDAPDLVSLQEDELREPPVTDVPEQALADTNAEPASDPDPTNDDGADSETDPESSSPGAVITYVGPAGRGDPFISADGRYVFFDANSIFGTATSVFDTATQTVGEIVLPGVDLSGGFTTVPTSISADGQVITFSFSLDQSDASSDRGTEFVYDRAADRIVDLSELVPGWGSSEAIVNPDGRRVVFLAYELRESERSGERGLWVYDRIVGTVDALRIGADRERINERTFLQGFSDDGRYLFFTSADDDLVPDDTNGVWDTFVHDQETGVIERVSVSSAGEQGNGNSSPAGAAISADGRLVLFSSSADNLVPGDTNETIDVFLHDRTTGETVLVSVARDGTQGDFHSFAGDMSANGAVIVFASGASNLVPSGRPGTQNIFVYYRESGCLRRLSVGLSGEEGDGRSYAPSISADGRFVVFSSASRNLVATELDEFPTTNAFIAEIPHGCD